MSRYERLGDQFKDSRNAARMLPRGMRRGLGQAEDLGSKIKLVANAVAAGAEVLEKPATPPAPAAAVSVDIPYVPVAIGVIAVVAAFYFLKKK